MTFRTYAEQILFGDSMKDKLCPPPAGLDDNRGPPLTKNVRPARPAGLHLVSPEGPRTQFPSRGQLEHSKARGQVLHFFANHELLALELMALALLRFPDAPASFRRRLVVTMRDEQRHLRLYLQRMAVLGVELGSIPLNSFFWDLLSPMERPIDFISGMSLTFEQANLDYSMYYRDEFRRVGDEETAEIMQTVLLDEVAHVRHGVHYLDEWRPDTQSQWDAYRESIRFPLTPARAKGITFTTEHRLDAGLDEDFIHRLRVYSHSKGRPPRVFLFNPAAELALAHGEPGYTPPQSVRDLAEDLELLPMFLMGREDALLVREPPPPEHLSRLMDLGYTIPELIVADLDAPKLSLDSNLSERRIADLCPWSWDPTVATFLEPLDPHLGHEAEGRTEHLARSRELSSKRWLVERWSGLTSSVPAAWSSHLLLSPSPSLCTTPPQILTKLKALDEEGYGLAVLKAPFGTAGHAAIRIREATPTQDQERWIDHILRTQDAVIVEPWFHRELDLSFLFELRKDGALIPLGLTRFLTDARGAYRGAYLGSPDQNLPENLRGFIYQGEHGLRWIHEIGESIGRALLPQLLERGFQGRAGIDMMVVRDREGALKLRAPLELNPRSTMGHIALALGSRLRTKTKSVWLLLGRRDLRACGSSDFAELFSRLSSGLDTETVGSPPRITRGVFATNDIHRARRNLSVVLVAPSMEEIHAALRGAGLPKALARHHLS